MWVNNDTLLAAATTRRDILASQSPAMKEEVKRFVEPALLRRARGAITRAFANYQYAFHGTAFTAVPAAVAVPEPHAPASGVPAPEPTRSSAQHVREWAFDDKHRTRREQYSGTQPCRSWFGEAARRWDDPG